MSLREQLLAAGLVSKKQAEQAEKGQRQNQHRHVKNNVSVPDETARKRAVAEAQAAKAARDQELNRQRQEQAERRAKAAQIKQLIEENRLPKLETDEYFNFVDRGKVRRLAVDTQRREQLIAGSLLIARCEGKYDVVLPPIAERIRERDERAVVRLDAAPSATPPAEEDPYKDFVVPDDLRW
jgi:hypothetical protein